MEKKITAFCKRFDMFPKGGKVLLALSGGMDSMCLAYYLKAQGIDFAAAHFNHRLRGEDADADESFVRTWCEQNGIVCYIGCADVASLAAQSGEGIEEAARKARYAFLEETAERIGVVHIATAHHALDNAETVLFNLVRGTGMDGLAGIPPRRGKFVRPLLTVTKEEIEAYAKENRVPYRTDKTNGDTTYTRNYIRHEILPKLDKINPMYAEHLSETALRLREESEYLNTFAAEKMDGLKSDDTTVSLPCETLQNAPQVLQKRMLRLMLDQLPVGKKDYTAAHFEALCMLALRSGEAQIDLPHGVVGINDGARFYLRFTQGETPKTVALAPNSTAHWGEYTISVRKASKNRPLADDIFYLPYDTISALRVGAWDASKRMALPQKQERSLKRLFAEHGISPEVRDHTPLIYCGEKVAAIYGIGTAAEFAVEDADAVQIEIKGNNHK